MADGLESEEFHEEREQFPPEVHAFNIGENDEHLEESIGGENMEKSLTSSCWPPPSFSGV